MPPGQSAQATHFRVALLIGFLVGAIACGTASNPSSPSPPDVTGAWVGPGFFSDTVRAQLTQSGSVVTGTFTSTQAGGTPSGPSGTVSGSVNGSNVSLTFTVPPPADCTFPVSANANLSGNQMTGTYATVSSSCPIRLTGNVSLTKQ